MAVVIANQPIDVMIQDQTSDIVDYYLCIQLFELALAQVAIIESNVITVVDGTDVIAGTYVCIQNKTRTFQAKILSKVGNELTLDTPLDFNFPINGTSVNNRSPQLNLDGSTNVVVGSLGPNSGVKWDITRIILSMTHVSAADDGRFGGIAALAKGIVVRKSDGVHHTIFNAKTNGDLRERMYDLTFSDRAPAGQYGTAARRTFAGQGKNGVVIRLDGDTEERIEIIIQDDLTDLTSFRVIAQGHVVEDSNEGC